MCSFTKTHRIFSALQKKEKYQNLSKLINFVEQTFNRRKYFGKDKGFVQRKSYGYNLPCPCYCRAYNRHNNDDNDGGHSNIIVDNNDEVNNNDWNTDVNDNRNNDHNVDVVDNSDEYTAHTAPISSVLSFFVFLYINRVTPKSSIP